MNERSEAEEALFRIVFMRSTRGQRSADDKPLTSLAVIDVQVGGKV